MRPLYTVRESTAFDHALLAACATDITLMQYIGRAVLMHIREYFPHAQRITIFCGTGHNGGDGLAFARCASDAGYTVTVLYIGDRATCTKTMALLYDNLPDTVTVIRYTETTHIPNCDIVIDALLGSGGNRAPEGIWQQAIDSINGCTADIIAIDIPSGLDADRGSIFGKNAVCADHTLCCFTEKIGLHTGSGLNHTGTIRCIPPPDDIPVTRPQTDATLSTIETWESEKRTPPRDCHKGTFGTVAVISGQYSGASILATCAAMRIGAGSVHYFGDCNHMYSLLSIAPECVYVGDVDTLSSYDRYSAICIGQGMCEPIQETQRIIAACRQTRTPIVVDAGAFPALTPDMAYSHMIITPHPKEAAQLLNTDVKTVQHDRRTAAQQLHARFGCMVVLKGAGTIVCGTEIDTVIGHGSPALACAGSGDILAGVIAGLAAQGYSPAAAARYGSVIHARAGEIVEKDGICGTIASDLLPAIRTLRG